MAQKEEKEKEEELPESIEKYKKIKDAAEEMISTIDHSHRAAWLHAEKEVLMEDGHIKREKLKDLKTRLKFADTMADKYDEEIEKYYNINTKLNEAEKETLRTAYSGLTRKALRNTASQLGKKFDFDVFYQTFAKGKAMEEIQENIRGAAYNHFTPDHIDDILKYTKSEHLFDAEALREDPKIANLILKQFEDVGAITSKYVKNLKEDPKLKYFLKKEEKEEKE
jgi:hypothetical protein